MALDRIEFVDAVPAGSSSPTVRLSLSGAPWSVLKDGTAVPPPVLQRAIRSTLLVDGESIPAAAFSNRVITLRLHLDSTSTTNAATQLQLLHRELNRPTNILRWQPEPSLPAVYFKTMRAPDYSPAHDHGLNLYDLTVTIPAEPFALGPREDIATATISNDPIAGTNGKFWDITGVKGDVETPLLMKVTGSALSTRQTLFAVRRRGTPSAMPFYIQAESMTMGTDTTVTATPNTDYSGAGNNYVTTSYATPSSQIRLSTATFPASPSVDARGQYRVYARVDPQWSGVDVVSQFYLQLQHGVRGILNRESLPFGKSSAFSFPKMVDLGLVQIPEGYDPVQDGASGTEMSVLGIPLTLYSRRSTATGTNRLDYLLFVPADDRLCIIDWGNTTPTNFVVDGINRMIYGVNGSNQISDVNSIGFSGDYPVVSPGVTNRIVFVRDVKGFAGSNDTPAGTTDVTVSYWPRYLYVRPVTT